MNNQLILTSVSIDELKSIVNDCIQSAISQITPIEAKQEDQELITESECCKRLHRSKVTLNDWRKRGHIPFYRIARKIYYNWDEVLSALKKIERKAV